MWHTRQIKQIKGDVESWSPEQILYNYDYDYDEYAPEDETLANMFFNEARATLYIEVINYLVQLDRTTRKQTRYYNLVLNYDAVSDDGVLLIFGEQAQRDAWEKSTDKWDYSSLFYDAVNWKHEYTSLSTLPEEYQLFLDAHRFHDDFDAIRDLLNAVAGDLNDFNWEGLLNVSEDFVIFAHDYAALANVDDEIRACVPEYKMRILRSKGLLK